MPSINLTGILALGLFWGLSPTLYKLMGDAQVPITHIILLTGFGVGLGLVVLQRFLGGRLRLDRATVLYGLGCGFLLNVPFATSLYFSRHLPVTVYALVVATSPLMTFLFGYLVGWEKGSVWRVAALATGFVSTSILILSQNPDDLGGSVWWIVAAFITPALYAFYNSFCQHAWPKGMEPLTAGVVESFASAVLIVPVLLLLQPFSMADAAAPSFWTGMGFVGLATVMWVAERVAYFNLIRSAGAVVTVQAVYAATPAGVLFGILLYSEKPTLWLFLSLALLVLALWLNNRHPKAA